MKEVNKRKRVSSVCLNFTLELKICSEQQEISKLRTKPIQPRHTEANTHMKTKGKKITVDVVSGERVEEEDKGCLETEVGAGIAIGDGRDLNRQRGV